MRREELLRPLPGILGLGLAYFLAAWGSLAIFATLHSSASPVWPPTGIAIAVLLVAGRRYWPGVFLGAFAANLAAAPHLGSAITIAIGNTLEALVAVWLIHRYAGGVRVFTRGRDVVSFAFLAGGLATAISALIGVASLVAWGLAPLAAAPDIALTWWLGDAGGALLVTPLLVCWLGPVRHPSQPLPATVATLAMLGLSVVLFMVLGALGATAFPVAFLSLPLVVAIAQWTDSRVTATSLFGHAAIAVWGTGLGSGPFAGIQPNDALLLLQVFLITVSMTGLSLAASIGESRMGRREMEVAVKGRTHDLRQAVAGLKEEVRARKRVQTALRRSEVQLEKAQELASLGSWTWEVATNEIRWSRGLFQLYGLDPADGAPDYEKFMAAVHPDDREALQALVNDCLEKHEPYDIDHRVIRPDGTERITRSHGAAELDSKGRVVRLYGVAQDITDRVAQDRRFKDLLESAPDGMIIADAEGKIIHCNARVRDLFGYEPDELKGERVEVLVPNGLREKHAGHREKYAESPRAREMGIGQDLRARRKDGSEFPVEVSLSPIETPEGRLVTAAVRDITQRKQSEETERLAFERLMEVEKLREVDRFRTRLLNSASHELNTPITPIKLQLHLLTSGTLGDLNERQQKAARVLSRNVDRLADLVGDILDVARLEAGRLKPQIAPIDLAVLGRETLESFQAQAKSAGVRLAADMPDDLAVYGDARRVSQILYNLVSNAIKFSPEGGDVTMQMRVADDSAIVNVADQGPGLEPDQISRLFQPFSQVHELTADAPPGTGLGLYISRGIAEAHGGSLRVTSPGRDQGATFTLHLPLRGPPEEDEPEGPGDLDVTPELPDTRDDEPDNRTPLDRRPPRPGHASAAHGPSKKHPPGAEADGADPDNAAAHAGGPAAATATQVPATTGTQGRKSRQT